MSVASEASHALLLPTQLGVLLISVVAVRESEWKCGCEGGPQKLPKHAAIISTHVTFDGL